MRDDAKHRVAVRLSGEGLGRRADRRVEEVARKRHLVEIGVQDGRALAGRNIFDAHVFGMAAAPELDRAGGAGVLDPAALAVRGHEPSVTVPVDERNRRSIDAARPSAGYREEKGLTRPDADAYQRGDQGVDEAPGNREAVDPWHA